MQLVIVKTGAVLEHVDVVARAAFAEEPLIGINVGPYHIELNLHVVFVSSNFWLLYEHEFKRIESQNEGE